MAAITVLKLYSAQVTLLYLGPLKLVLNNYGGFLITEVKEFT